MATRVDLETRCPAAPPPYPQPPLISPDRGARSLRCPLLSLTLLPRYAEICRDRELAPLSRVGSAPRPPLSGQAPAATPAAAEAASKPAAAAAASASASAAAAAASIVDA